MSLVTTARSSSPPSVRHSAAASAVFPEPTGPPRPTRRGPSPPARSCRCGAATSTQSSRLWSGGKVSIPSCEVHLREEVEQRIGRGREPAEMAISAPGGDVLDLGGEPGGERGDGQRVHRQQPLGGGRRAADRQVGGRGR